VPGNVSDQSQLPFEDTEPQPEFKPRESGRVVRVLPDVGGIDRPFDYLVPQEWENDGRGDALEVGSRVRIPFGARRVAGWVVEDQVNPPEGVNLRELTKLSGKGPSLEIIEISRWASYRWYGRVSAVLKTASPTRNINRLPATRSGVPVNVVPPSWAIKALEEPRRVLRMPPSEDPLPLIKAAVKMGDTLVVVPSIEMSKELSQNLDKLGIPVALLPDQWAEAAAGGVVIGTRSAAFAPVRKLAAVIVLDEHDESLKEERMPTWHAREVAAERADRAGVPCVLVSPTPSLEALQWGELQTFPKIDEYKSWPEIKVIDRRSEDPIRTGLLSDALVPLIRENNTEPTICVLNRKGRSRLLACTHCGELVRCDSHQTPLIQDEEEIFICPIDGERRPQVCNFCGSTKFKNLRAGISRVREEIEALARQPVIEITSETEGDIPECNLYVGTTAVLNRFPKASQVIFLDFDQEILAQKFRANEQSLALLAHAARLVGKKENGGKLIVQTRQPDHEVLRAAIEGDPDLLSGSELQRRKLLNLPPFTALAKISGPSAPIFMKALGKPKEAEIMGPKNGSWLIKTSRSEELARILSQVERPSGRLRIEVDPYDV
jgi:primosomal protein N' (replication factor Y)